MVKAAHWLTHVEHDWESPVWRHWLAALGQRHTMVRYDGRDTRLSDREVARVSLDAWVEDLEAVVDDLELSRFALFAMCQAGPTAIAYAARHPERVSRLVLYGMYALGRLERDPSPDQHRQVDALITLMGLAWGEDNPAVRQLWTARFLPGDPRAAAVVQRTAALVDDGCGRRPVHAGAVLARRSTTSAPWSMARWSPSATGSACTRPWPMRAR